MSAKKLNTGIFPLNIYYESGCALCNAEMTNLMLRNRRNLLRFTDVSQPGFDTPPPGVQTFELLELIHAQRADGGVIRGVEVFRLAYAAAELGWVSRALRLPLIAPVADRAYPWVARNRHRFPRRLIAFVFETGVRRAAERAAARTHCSADGSCRL